MFSSAHKSLHARTHGVLLILLGFGSGAWAQSAPDMEVRAITFTVPLQVGVETKAVAELVNVGTADTGLFSVTWYLDGNIRQHHDAHGSLAPGASSDELDKISFTFTPAAGEHTLKFAVDEEDNVAELDESNNSQQVVMNLLADLEVSNITFSAPPQLDVPVDVMAHLSNVGQAPSGNFNVRWLRNGEEIGFGGHETLAPGEVSSGNVFFRGWTPSTPGSYTFRFEADLPAPGNVTEHVEVANNAFEATVTVGSDAKADLEVSDITFSAPPQVNVPVDVMARLANIGQLASGTFNVRWILNGNQVGFGGHESLAPGAVSTGNVFFRDWTPSAPGDYTFRFEADLPAPGEVEEQEEIANNSFEKTVTVAEPGQPDLRPHSMIIVGTPRLNEPLEVGVQLTNDGTAPTEDFGIQWFVDGEPKDAHRHAQLDPGHTTTHTFNSFVPMEPRTYTVRFVADVGGEVAESNELNNAVETQFTLEPQEPTVQIGLSTTALTRNAEGWYVENPVQVDVTLSCPSGGGNCAAPFDLDIFSNDGSRFFVYAMNSGSGSSCPSSKEGTEFSFRSYHADCHDTGPSSLLTVPSGTSRTLRWSFWAQPSEEASIEVAAQWSSRSDAGSIAVQQAEIHPLVFIHGILGSMFPDNVLLRSQQDMRDRLDPLTGIYWPFMENLQKMGYEWDRTLYALAYDWRQSNRISGGFLAESLRTVVIPNASATPYARRDGKADLVVHSMGGLVARAYVQGEGRFPTGDQAIPYQDDVRRVVFIAVPHKGFPFDYRTLEGLTWHDYLETAPLIPGIYQFLMDETIWPTLIAKKFRPLESEISASPYCRPGGLSREPGMRVQAVDTGVVFICELEFFAEMQHSTVPGRGIDSLIEMLPTSDQPVYLVNEDMQPPDVPPQEPYGVRANPFLENLNATIGELVAEAGADNLFVLYGENAPETDAKYEVEPPRPPLWRQGDVTEAAVREGPVGDDLVTTSSAILSDLISLPAGNQVGLNAAPAEVDDPFLTGGRHKGIMWHGETQTKWVPSWLAGVELPFATTRVAPFAPLIKVHSIISACPIDLLVIDPQGRRLGFDPESGTVVREIPNSIYTAARTEPQMILIGDPIPGEYEIVATGFDSDFYALDAKLHKGDRAEVVGVFAGTTEPGQQDHHRVTLEPNEPPVAANDTYRVPPNEVLDVPAPGLLENDSDPDGDALEAILVDLPTHGQLELRPDGSFRYTPEANFEGEDSFSYRASDAEAVSETAVVTLRVRLGGAAPVAEDDLYQVDDNCWVLVRAPGVLGNDFDPDGDPLTAVLETGPEYGELILRSDGSFLYVPRRNFRDTDHFTYRASDGELFSAPALATIKPNGDCRLRSSGAGTHYRSIGRDSGALAGGEAQADARLRAILLSPTSGDLNRVGRGDVLVLSPGTDTEEVLYILAERPEPVGDGSFVLTVETPPEQDHRDAPFRITRAFQSIQTWESSRQGDLVAEERLEVGVCYNDRPFTRHGEYDIAEIDGSVTDKNHFLWLTVAPGHRHDGTAGTGVLLDGQNSVKHGIRIRDDYTRVEGLELRRFRNDNGASAIEVRRASNVLLQDLLIHNFDSDDYWVYGIKGSWRSEFTARNCMIYDGDAAAIGSNRDESAATVENCTIYGMEGRGIHEDEGVYTVINTLSLGNERADFDVRRGSQRHNASSDDTAAGENSLVFVPADEELISIERGEENLHLRSTARSIDTGLDLSKRFDSDIDGDHRPLAAGWDVGADEWVEPEAEGLHQTRGAHQESRR